MYILKRSFLLIIALLFSIIFVNAQCPGCVTNTACTVSPAYPHICPDTLPEGMANQPYSTDVSFWMPTNFVDVGSGVTVTLNKLTVVDIVGLPFGLNWQTNAANNIFFPSSNPPTTEYGCAKICGTPIFAGTYNVTAYVHVEVGTPFGNQTSDDSFVLPITIVADTSGGSSFTITNPQGCGSVTTSFQTNMPSNGHSGFSYLWNLGNGLTSSAENPPSQTYNQGTYTIVCNTTVDTLNFNYLTNVSILGGSCDDIFSNPDYYVKILDQQNTQIYKSATIDDQYPPLSFSIPSIQLTAQNYKIETWNENGGLEGSDQLCKSFTIYGLSQGTTLSSGQNVISYTVNHPTFSFSDTAFITVFPNPSTPVISSLQPNTACMGDTIVLSTGSQTQYQWYNDTTFIIGGNTQSINTVTSGGYRVVITDINGCSASSLPYNVTFYSNPPKPTFWKTGNVIQTMLSGFNLQWYLNSVAIPSETGQTCTVTTTGYYSVLASLNGCSTWSDSVLYSPIGNSVENESKINELAFFPNPSKGMLNMKANFSEETELTVEITDILGKTYFREQYSIGLSFSKTLDLSSLSKGIYLLKTSGDNFLRTEKIVLQ